MVKRLASGLAFLLLLSGAAQAACSGSGAAYTCATGSTAAQIQGAINSVSAGGTVTLDDGTYSLSATLSLNGKNGITVACESVRGCTLTRSGTFFAIDSIASDVSALVRISGFIFDQNSAGAFAIWFYGVNDMTSVRIDNNTFDMPADSYGIVFGGSDEDSSGNSIYPGAFYGVIDHNIFTSSGSIQAVRFLSGGGPVWSDKNAAGTGRAMFIEDNTSTVTTVTNNGIGFMDAWMSPSYVVRYNTLTNTRQVTHSYCHTGGPYNQEVYGNTITNTGDNNYRNIHFQGSGEIYVWDNVINSTGAGVGPGGHLAILNYRSDGSQLPQGSCGSTQVCNGTNTTGDSADGVPGADGNRSGGYGYPCWHQPGRNKDAELKPVYEWLNRDHNGVRTTAQIESGNWTGLDADCANNNTDRINCHIQTNRDIFFGVSMTAQSSPTSPFDGTSGIGHGTLANRPTTCSAGTNVDTEDAGMSGVGYWATDVKTLYRCATTNTWVVHYRPYVYPHPLVSGKPAPPLNPRTQ